MPERRTLQRARQGSRRRRSPSTRAGEFVREEIHHVRQGKHGARSTRQAIAIGLSKARRAGEPVKPPKRGRTSEATRHRAEQDLEAGRRQRSSRPSPRRSRAVMTALRREGRAAGSRRALSRQARTAARRRPAAERSASARKAARSRTAADRSRSARKAARTRSRRARGRG